MRITFNMMTGRILDDLMSSSERLMAAQKKAASGKRISSPSDDVSGTGRALNLRSTISEIEQYLRNGNIVKSELAAAHGALDSIVSAIRHVRDLALQAANSTMTPEARLGIAAELDQILITLAADGNTQHAGKYIFAGTKTNTPPIAATGVPIPPYSYDGNNMETTIQVAPWTSMCTNVTGDVVFNMGGAAVPTAPDLFSTIQALKEEVVAGDTQAISNRLTDIDANLSNVAAIRSQVGAWLNRLEATTEALLDSKLIMADLLSKTEDIDFAEALVELRTRENIYQAAIATSSRILQLSLADYLE